MTRGRRAAALTAMVAAIAMGGIGGPAAAQAVFRPSQSTPFGPPSTRLPSAAPDMGSADLPAPTDRPDPAAGPAKPDADLAFGAYQRGFYATAMREAMKRLGRNNKDGAAMTLVGELYAQGLGVRANKTEAARWYALAAKAGDPQAMFELGIAYMRGDGLAQDRDHARLLFTQAAAHNNPGADFYLGLMALQGNGVASDPKTAAIYFKRSADGGFAEAQYALGLMFREGNGVAQDDTRAAELIKAAADNDNIAAMVDYAIMVFNGIGVTKDEPAAAHYFLKAAGRNNPVAQDRVARLYVAGRGVAKDIVEGMKWHVLAKTAGHEDAWLDDEMRKLTPDQREAVDRAVRRYVGT